MARGLKRQMQELPGRQAANRAIVMTAGAGIVVFDRDARFATNESIRKLLDIHGEPQGKCRWSLYGTIH
jgi:hypothetical protein